MMRESHHEGNLVEVDRKSQRTLEQKNAAAVVLQREILVRE